MACAVIANNAEHLYAHHGRSNPGTMTIVCCFIDPTGDRREHHLPLNIKEPAQICNNAGSFNATADLLENDPPDIVLILFMSGSPAKLNAVFQVKLLFLHNLRRI